MDMVYLKCSTWDIVTIKVDANPGPDISVAPWSRVDLDPNPDPDPYGMVRGRGGTSCQFEGCMENTRILELPAVGRQNMSAFLEY